MRIYTVEHSDKRTINNMPTKKELLKNIHNYSPQEIADAVRAGVVSLYELNKETEGAFTPLLKRQVKNILDAPATSPQDTKTDLQTSVIETAESQETPTNPVFETAKPEQETIIPVITFNKVVSDDDGFEKVDTPHPQVSTTASGTKPAMFSRIFSFKGRIRRLEYGLTMLAYYLWSLPMDVMTEDQIPPTYAIIYLATILPILWILFAQGAKRCHDRGNSGWYQLIPFYGFWMLFADSESGKNKYGECPK